jgi:Ca2+-binding RTX toxin-like protein
MEGGLGKDTLSGYGTGDTLNGGDGDDTLTGYGGGNFLAGGDGNDTLSITGSGSGDMRGGAGNDSLFLTTNGGAIAFGDEGADKFNLRYGPSNVIFRINDFEASAGDTIVVSSTLGDLTNISQLQLVQADPSNSILYQLSYLSPLPDPSFPPMERVIAEIIWVDPSPPVISSSIFSIGVL